MMRVAMESLNILLMAMQPKMVELIFNSINLVVKSMTLILFLEEGGCSTELPTSWASQKGHKLATNFFTHPKLFSILNV